MPSFSARTLELHGARFTSEAIVRKILGMDSLPNLFRLETDAAAAKLVRLPAVQSTNVTVRLPSTVIVTLVEREPKLVWVIGDVRYVVDQDGLLFGEVDEAGNPVPSSAEPIPLPTPVVATPTPSRTPVPSGSFDANPSPTASPTPNSQPDSRSPRPRRNRHRRPRRTRRPLRPST